MAANEPSPDLAKSSKRKSRDSDPSASSASARKRSFEDDRLSILKGALDFKKRTGAAPTKSTRVAFFESLKGLVIDENLTADQVFNKLRHCREKLNHPPKTEDDAYRLSLELWQVNLDKMEQKKDMKKKKDKKDNVKKGKDVVESCGSDKATKMEIHNETEQEVDLQIEENTAANNKKEIYKMKKKKDKKDRKAKNNYMLKPRRSEKEQKMELDSESEEEDEGGGEAEEVHKQEAKENEEDIEEGDNDEEDKEVVKKLKVDANGREGGSGIQSFHYVKQAVADYWKSNGLSSLTLKDGLKLVDPAKARAVDEMWKRHLHEEMRLLIDCSKMKEELLVTLYEVHKKI